MKTDEDVMFTERFAAITDTTDDSDWADVLRRRTASTRRSPQHANRAITPTSRDGRLRLFHPRRRVLVLALAALALVGGFLATPALGIRDSILHTIGVLHPAPPSVALPSDESDWLRTIFANAHNYPQARFDNPPESVLRQRLAQAAALYNFTVERVDILHPAQDAPFIAVRSSDPQRLARATPAILRLIDPKAPTGDDRTGWAYEGFFFEARDDSGVPFLYVFNHWRGPHAGGGQWARSNDLFPFDHL